jgi:hypothetical protein
MIKPLEALLPYGFEVASIHLKQMAVHHIAFSLMFLNIFSTITVTVA